MARLLKPLIAVGCVSFCVAACTSAQPSFEFITPKQPRGLTCDTASANVTSFGRSTVKLYADLALKHQVSEVRGYMFSAGLRRIQLVQQTNDCTPAGMFTNLYQCTARAQLCGR